MNNTSDNIQPQRVTVEVDIIPGPFIEAVAERLLRLITDELLKLGTDVTRTRVEIHGRLAAW